MSSKKINKEIEDQKREFEDQNLILIEETDYDRAIIKQELAEAADETFMSPRLIRFADEYVIDFNKTEAAVRAGIHPWNAVAFSSNALRHPMVKKRIERKRRLMQQRLNKRFEVSQERIAEELAKIALSTPQDFYDDDGNPIPIQDLTEDAAAAISEIEVKEKISKSGKKERTYKYKTHNKITANTELARHLGMYEKENRLARETNLNDILKHLPEEAREVLKIALLKKIEG